MATFYKKNDKGEYEEADNAVDELFRQKSDAIIRAKLESSREKYEETIRNEIDKEVRANVTETIKTELRTEIEKEYKEKLDLSEQKVSKLDTELRRKTIAAEYGFKPEVEQFLGDGNDEDMRSKADALKASFSENNTPKLDKQTEPQVSKLQQKTGITVDIK